MILGVVQLIKYKNDVTDKKKEQILLIASKQIVKFKCQQMQFEADLLKRIAEKLLKVHPDDIDVDLVWNTYGLGQRTCGKHAVSNPKYVYD